MRPRTLFIYHGSCFDGFTSSWVFRRFFSGDDVDFHPAKYGSEPPNCKGKDVWVVDFSYPFETMAEKVILPSVRTRVFDHHKTAQATLDGILQAIRIKYNVQREADRVVFDMNRSGSGILFDELSREAGMKAGTHKPRYNGMRDLWLVDYIEDRDLWHNKLPESEFVSAYVSSMQMTFENWDKIESEGFTKAFTAGQAVKRYIDLFGEKARAQHRYELIGGYNVPTINTPYMNCSEHVGKLAEEHPDAKFAAGYFRRDDGRWQFSLRSRGDFDVSEVAQKFGGGGHKGAAGFDVDVLPWESESPKPLIHFGGDSV